MLDAKINANLVSSSNWNKTDILISTPQLLYNIIMMGKHRQPAVQPKFIIIDEADLLLEIDKNLSYCRMMMNLSNYLRKKIYQMLSR